MKSANGLAYSPSNSIVMELPRHRSRAWAPFRASHASQGLSLERTKSVQGESASSTSGAFLKGSELPHLANLKSQPQKNRPYRPVFSIAASPVKKNNVRQKLSGAGRGNRTLVGSLGSYCSTIKLYPLRAADFVPDSATDLKFFFYS